jgi:ribosomal protein L7/L12
LHHEDVGRSRETLLQEQVTLLAAGLGIEAADSVELIPAEVVRLAREGKTMKAIGLLRKRYRLGLLSAKRIVDAARTDDGARTKDAARIN